MEFLQNIENNFPKKDFRIIAVSEKNEFNENIWILLDPIMIDDYFDSQHSLFLKNKHYLAEDFDFKQVYIYDIEKGIDRFSSLDDLKDTNFSILAQKSRLNSQPVWQLVDYSLLKKHENRLVSIKKKDIYYHASEYRIGVVIIQNKFSKEYILIDKISCKLVMKK